MGLYYKIITVAMKRLISQYTERDVRIINLMKNDTICKKISIRMNNIYPRVSQNLFNWNLLLKNEKITRQVLCIPSNQLLFNWYH